MNKRCVVMFTDANYLGRYIDTVGQLRTRGKYEGDIVLIPHPELKDTEVISKIEKSGVIVKFFDLLDLDFIIRKNGERPDPTAPHHKMIQWQKLHIFDVYFKNWDQIFYIDVGMQIFKDIFPFWNLIESGKLTAHSDTYPTYVWKLGCQFAKTYPEVYNQLSKDIDLEVDYFQSTMLLFNSDIITPSLKEDILSLGKKYHICRTNEQAAMNIYFNGIHKIWNPLPVHNGDTFTYDFLERYNHHCTDYIMLKYPKTC